MRSDFRVQVVERLLIQRLYELDGMLEDAPQSERLFDTGAEQLQLRLDDTADKWPRFTAEHEREEVLSMLHELRAGATSILGV